MSEQKQAVLVILSSESTRIVAGKLVKDEIHYVADAAGNLVGRKAHSTKEEAEQELAGLGGFAEGLEFAKAQYPALGEKAHVGKANVIAEFLAWQAAGKPVKEAAAAGATDDATDEPQAEGADAADEAAQAF